MKTSYLPYSPPVLYPVWYRRSPAGLLVMDPPASYDSSRYLNPLTDFGFKHIFKSDSDKEILIAFLNELFKGKKIIRDIQFCSTEYEGEDEETKRVVFDLLCRGDDGEYFLIEMQRGYQDFFKQRALHYISRLISEDLPRGKKGQTYDLKEVYLIAIMDFNLPDSPEDTYLHEVCLIYKNKSRIFYDRLEYKFIELPKFTKDEHELRSDLDKWLYLLKNLGQMNGIPGFLDSEIFRKVFKKAEIKQLGKEQQDMYKLEIDAGLDYKNVMDYQKRIATEEGLKEGLKEGLEEGRKAGRRQGLEEGRKAGRKEGLEEGREEGRKAGRKEGLEEGREEGRKAGREEAEESIVKRLLRETDFDNEKIASLTGVEIPFVEKMRVTSVPAKK